MAQDDNMKAVLEAEIKGQVIGRTVIATEQEWNNLDDNGKQELMDSYLVGTYHDGCSVTIENLTPTDPQPLELNDTHG